MIRPFTLPERLLFNAGSVALAPAFLALLGIIVRVSHGRPVPAFLLYLLAASLATGVLLFLTLRLVRGISQTPRHPAPEGLPLVVDVRRARLLAHTLGWFLVLWVLGTLLGRQLPIANGVGTIAGIVAFAVVFLASRRLLFAEYLLRLDVHGLDHYRYGSIRWADTGGLRLDSDRYHLKDRYWLAILVPRPEALLPQLPGRAHLWLHFMLRRRLTLIVPLGYATADPAVIYEAAVSRRQANPAPALFGCTGLGAIEGVSSLATAIGRGGGSSSEREDRLRRAMGSAWNETDTPEAVNAKLQNAPRSQWTASELDEEMSSLTKEFDKLTQRRQRATQWQWAWVAGFAVFALGFSLLLHRLLG